MLPFFVFVHLLDVFMLFMFVKSSCKKNNESIFELETSLYTLLTTAAEIKTEKLTFQKTQKFGLLFFSQQL